MTRLPLPPPHPPSGSPPPYGPPGEPAFPAFPPPPAPRRRPVLPLLLAGLLAVVLIGAAVLVPFLLPEDDDAGDAAGDDERSAQVDTSSLDAVEEYGGLTNDHVAPGETVDYPQSPPVGGDHTPYWLECGVYDEPVPVESLVHDLEHGTVVLTYRSGDVDAAGIELLARQLPANGIVAPYDDQEAPVVITVWGRQLALTGPEDPRIELFVARFGAGETAPEPFASCHGGVDPAQLPPFGTTA